MVSAGKCVGNAFRSSLYARSAETSNALRIMNLSVLRERTKEYFLWICFCPLLFTFSIISVAQIFFRFITCNYDKPRMVLLGYFVLVLAVFVAYACLYTDFLSISLQKFSAVSYVVFKIARIIFTWSFSFWPAMGLFLATLSYFLHKSYEYVRQKTKTFLDDTFTADELERSVIDGESKVPASEEAVDSGDAADVVLSGWGSRAFDRNQKFSAPSRCLKIRGLLKENDPATVLDMSLVLRLRLVENNGQVISWAHLAIDSEPGFLYVMFRDLQDASVAFNRMNGFYYNGRLVAVRFLRHEKYAERFPNCAKL
ncbi:unnamed protein product [Caenorhabditis auriculariae]|uniref:RRM domain-containing protein n=1 Tax=Caenorhabditis auriculariae TaxID=2777116 RepID=A0A8S1HWY3_9PELO|nr:unnamed protein product [Caenorhabditis auriculariae]